MNWIWLQFFVGAFLIIIAGIKLTRSADIIGRALGMGAGWAGVLLLPLATSLPELITSLRAVLIDAPDLAVGNLLGSNLFNITIIALVDILQGKGSLFFRVRVGHVLSATFGILLLTIVSMSFLFPFPHFHGRVGLDTLLLMGGYLVAVRLLTRYERHHNTFPKNNDSDISEGRLIKSREDFYTPKAAAFYFFIAAVVILFAGVALTDASEAIAQQTGLGRTFVGSIMLAISTSLPELVTTSMAVRLGKLDMAIGNIFGANIINMFIIFIVDFLYVPGPLLQAVSSQHLITAVMTIMLTSIAIIGLVYRSKKYIWFIGYDSLFILIGYLIAFTILFFSSGV